METSQSPQIEKIFLPIKKIVTDLPSMGSLIIIIPALAYGFGLIELHVYYINIGAKWATTLLSNQQIISGSTEFIFFVILLFFILILQPDIPESAPPKPSKIELKRRNAICEWSKKLRPYFFHLFYLLFYYYLLLLAFRHPNIGSLVIIFPIAIGMWVIFFMKAKSKKYKKLSSKIIVSMFFSIFLIPAFIGKTQADYDMDSNFSSRQPITLKEGNEKDFRLISAVGDKMLIVSTDKEKKHLFKLVSSDEIQTYSQK